MDKNIKFQHFALTQTERANIKLQSPVCLWMTGLSGSGKSTLANADAYPRFGPTSLWDMAAGHAILKETGGEIYTLDQQPLVYNMNQILNPDLIAVRNKKLKFNVEDKHEAKGYHLSRRFRNKALSSDANNLQTTPPGL